MTIAPQKAIIDFRVEKHRNMCPPKQMCVFPHTEKLPKAHGFLKDKGGNNVERFFTVEENHGTQVPVQVRMGQRIVLTREQLGVK